jgi:type I restriction enzyme S subunit
MATPLKPYPAYKPAAVPWLQQVPEHWEVLPNRALFAEVNEAGRPEDEMLSVTIGRGVLKQAEHLATTTKKDSSRKDKSTYKRVGEGDIVYNKMRAWQGAFGMSRYSGIVSPAYVVQRPRPKAVSEFYHYLMRTPLFAKEAERNSYGLASDIWNLRPEHFKGILNVCPPVDEQHLIVRYLHALDAKVKRYIRTKRKLIAALQEQKQAIIQRAVTRGLDPNVKLKPSGVEWLGEVPEHWELVRNSMLYHETTDRRFKGDETRLSLSQRDGLVATEVMKERTLLAVSTHNFKICEPHDLIVNRFKAHLGVFFASWTRGVVTFHYGVFRPVRAMRTKYFEHLYHTIPYRAVYGGVSNGMVIGLQNLSNMGFYGVRSIVPPIVEQDAILQHIERESMAFDNAIGHLQKDIATMLEYHKRLIADVVTGAVDVREAAKAMKEETPVAMEEELEIETEVEEEHGTE